MLHRRLGRDYEALPARSEAMIHLAMIDLMAAAAPANPPRPGEAPKPGPCRTPRIKRPLKWHRGQVRKRQGVTYDMGRARALAEAAIREAAQVRNHPPDLINPVVALNRPLRSLSATGPSTGWPR